VATWFLLEISSLSSGKIIFNMLRFDEVTTVSISDASHLHGLVADAAYQNGFCLYLKAVMFCELLQWLQSWMMQMKTRKSDTVTH